MRRDTETGRVRLSLRVDFTLHPATGAAACAAVRRSSRTSRHDGAATGAISLSTPDGSIDRGGAAGSRTGRSTDARADHNHGALPHPVRAAVPQTAETRSWRNAAAKGA